MKITRSRLAANERREIGTASRFSSTLLPLIIIIAFPLAIAFQTFGQTVDLEKQKWIHGSVDCAGNKDGPFQILKYDESTYIIRQSKCLNYEAPFIYLFIGNDRALLVDTGAEAPPNTFPLYETVKKILTRSQDDMLPLLVIHSHGHSDHYAGDYQFKDKPGVEVVPPTKEAIIDFLKMKNWPEDLKVFDLGGRSLTIIPIPGHDEMSIAVYDPQTLWLLTGDTIYPGRLYVRDGNAFLASIARLKTFIERHQVQWIMGNHIEMTRTKGVDYPVGTLYQPDEHPLPLGLSVFQELLSACSNMRGKVVHNVHNDFIIIPK